jgi:predicted HicB family RNase H-like nuclease
MKDALIYKGLTGTVHFSIEERIFFGKIEGVNDLITFEGNTLDEVEEAFKSMVDIHLHEKGD